MRKLYSEQGSINALLAPLVIVILLFFGAVGFGSWAYMSRQDYKGNVDKKIAAAVKVAVQAAQDGKDKEFIEKEKLKLRTYQGPEAFGSISLKYPKTWSVYADESNDSELLLSLHPGFVPAGADGEFAYALSVKVLSQPYSETIAEYDTFISDGSAKARPYRLKSQPKELGLKITGKIASEQSGEAIVLPLRDKSIIISTLANEYISDFERYILPNFNFQP